jgi:hypothetical protein
MNTEQRLLKLRSEKPDYLILLKACCEAHHRVEQEAKERARKYGYSESAWLGFEHTDIRLDTDDFKLAMSVPRRLNILANLGFLEITLRTNSSTYYKVVNIGEVEGVLEEIEQLGLKREYRAMRELEIPDDLFDVIVGYDDVKELMLKSLKSNMPLFRNFLLIGPPHSGKTTFLLELERIPGAFFIAGESGATKVGIREVITNLKPLILCVDEVDKLPTLDREILLSPTDEYSRTSIVKHGVARVEQVNTKIFCAANPPKERFSSQFLDRFWVLEFPPYTEKEFLEVSQNILVMRRGIDATLAEQISLEVWNLTRSIRDSLRVAEAIKAGMGLEKCVAILSKYKNTGLRRC